MYLRSVFFIRTLLPLHPSNMRGHAARLHRPRDAIFRITGRLLSLVLLHMLLLSVVVVAMVVEGMLCDGEFDG